jgi:hypothetical protein
MFQVYDFSRLELGIPSVKRIPIYPEDIKNVKRFAKTFDSR